MRRFQFRGHRGTSLVEILVAMVILLIGIFSLVRLFPAGFTQIIYGRNVSEARALTQSMIEAARVRYTELPDAVEAVNPLTQTTFPMLPVDQELTAFQPNPGQPPDTRFSDVNKVRRILGEGAPIPAPSTTSPYMPADRATGQRVAVSTYVLSYSPIYSVDPTKSGLGGITVYSGTPLRRIVFEGPPDQAELAALDESSYGIDYGSATLYFKPVGYARQFKVQYSFTINAGTNGFLREQSRPDNCAYIAPNQGDYDMRQAHPNQPPGCVFLPLPKGARLEPDRELLFRGFQRLLPAQAFSNEDPYQFKVLNSVVGIIGFNPLAAAVRPGGPNSAAITAKIDYDVDDWHIIHEDRVVPGSPPNQVKLTLDGVLPIGSVDEYQERYNGLIKEYPDRPAPTTRDVDLLVVDLETGLTMDSRSLQRPGSSPSEVQGSDLNGQIDYRDGSITFQPLVQWTLPSGALAPLDPIAGKRLRIYYRTQQNWALQLTKAFSNYIRQPNINNLGYGEYAVGSKGYLFFPTADHGQAVLIDYTWVHRVNGQDIVRTETGEYHQISDPAQADSPQNLFGAPYPTDWWAQVDAAQRPGFVDGSILVQRVRGVTVRSRAIWREGTRWRRLDLDSFVGRDRET